MNPVAREALSKLLKSAENAQGKGNTERIIRVLFSEASLPSYFTIASQQDKDACHGALLLAERDGAIQVTWERQAGAHGQVKRIVLEDAEKLAQYLGVTPRWDAVQKARLVLGEWVNTYPVLEDVLAKWSIGQKPRGTSPQNVIDWTDAARVLKYVHNSDELDIPVRRISTHLTCDSKRVETLWDIIDVLLRGDLQTPVRCAEEVFSEIGLVKFPSTILLAGDVRATLSYRDGEDGAKLPTPYVGLPPGGIRGFQAGAEPVSLLTVENLTTFHELCGLCNADHGRILLYTGGMPSPSWKKVYLMLLRSLPEESRVHHWGDIDAGGFRIASQIAQICRESNRTLTLFKMAIETSKDKVHASARGALSVSDIQGIERICAQWGWKNESLAAANHKLAFEQESIPVAWPE